MTKLVGIKATVTMSRTLYIEVPEEATEEEILKKANEEIILPHNAMYMACNALKRTGIRINKLDLKDWEVTEYDIKQIEQPEGDAEPHKD